MASSVLVSNPARGETEAWDKRVHHLLPLLYLNIAYIVYTVFASGRICFLSFYMKISYLRSSLFNFKI